MSGDNKPHIFFIVLDTVRLKNFFYNSSGESTTPFINDFLEECITFENCYSPAPMTVPSHASMFTGALEEVHKTNNNNRQLNKNLKTIAEVLSSVEYNTVGFSNNSHVSPEFGFDRGFDVFKHNLSDSYGEPFENGFPTVPLGQKLNDNPLPVKMLQAAWIVHNTDYSVINTGRNWFHRRYLDSELKQPDRGALSTNRFVDDYLTRNKDPLFLFLNYMEAHDPYRFPEQFRHTFSDMHDISRRSWSKIDEFYREGTDFDDPELRYMRSQYDGAIRYLDFILEDLIRKLKSNGYYDDALIFVTSDHGEAFGENKLYGHRGGLYNELIKVPLLIKLPENNSDHQSVIQSPVSNRWIISTILKYLDIPLPELAVEGDLLSPSRRNPISESPSIEPPEDARPDYSRYKDEMKCIVDSDGKYIYYASTDEFEGMCLEDSESKRITDEMKENILSLFDISTPNEAHDETRSIDPATEAHLNELGYK